MKKLITAIIILVFVIGCVVLFSGCSNDSCEKKAQQVLLDSALREESQYHSSYPQLASLADSVDALMRQFMDNGDTSILHHAVNINNRLLELDTTQYGYGIHVQRGQQMYDWLKMPHEAFLVSHRPQKGSNQLYWMVYHGLEQQMAGNYSAAEHLYRQVCNKCDSILADTLDLVAVTAKMSVYYCKNDRENALGVINRAIIMIKESERKDKQEIITALEGMCTSVEWVMDADQKYLKLPPKESILRK